MATQTNFPTLTTVDLEDDQLQIDRGNQSLHPGGNAPTPDLNHSYDESL